MRNSTAQAFKGLDVREPEAIQWGYLKEQEHSWQMAYKKEIRTGNSRNFFRKIRQSIVGPSFQELTERHAADLDRYLLSHRKTYKKLSEANLNLLAQQGVKWKVTARRHGWFGSYTDSLLGRLETSGRMRLFAKPGATTVGIRQDLCFPTAFEGRIDPWGNLKLEASSYGYGPNKTLPKSYLATILPDGRIRATLHQSQWLGAPFSAQFMHHLSAKHFEPTASKGVQWRTNLAQMQAILLDLRHELQR